MGRALKALDLLFEFKPELGDRNLDLILAGALREDEGSDRGKLLPAESGKGFREMGEARVLGVVCSDGAAEGEGV